MKTSVYIATSLDGFIAREDGAIDWLLESDTGSGEDYGYKEFIGTVDILMMGRGTFEKVVTFDKWPYTTRVVVLTSRPLAIPQQLSADVEVMSGSPRELHDRLAARGTKHIYLDGGKTIQGFLNAGLVDRIIVTRIPILIGSGIPLFGSTLHDIKLRHVETRSYESGFVQSEYALSHAADT